MGSINLQHRSLSNLKGLYHIVLWHGCIQYVPSWQNSYIMIIIYYGGKVQWNSLAIEILLHQTFRQLTAAFVSGMAAVSCRNVWCNKISMAREFH